MTEQNNSIKALRGPVLTFRNDPFLNPGSDSFDYWSDGMVVISGGHIVDAGPWRDVDARNPGIENVDRYEDAVIMPGFIDCHVHYVQLPMVASYGDTLLSWLNQYTFPTEARFRDKDFARLTAEMFFRQLFRAGTTTANVFATTFAESVDALFEEAEKYNARIISGKVLQDRNLPDNLKDTSACESVELSEELLKKWHRRGRALYAVVPRFAPTSSSEQLALAGGLYQRYISDGVYMHTHLDEADNEIEWVRELFPDADNYTDVYRRAGLLGERSVMAHCCIVSPREWDMLYENGCGVVHCPSSNLFLGDGQFKFWEAKDKTRPCNVGVGTDIGAGTSFSILRQLGEAYKVGMLQMRSLDAVRSFYLATRGAASTLRLDDCIGSIAPGMEADITVLDLKATEFLEWRMDFARDIADKLFILQTLAPDNVVKATYVAGEKVFSR